MDRPRHRSEPLETEVVPGLERLVFFSDAVFAIAITLLVLEIHIPEVAPSEISTLPQMLIDLWPRYVTYALGFLVVGVSWMGHHRLFRYIKRYDDNLLRLSLLYLLTIAFLPFPNDLIGTYPGVQAVVIFYAGVLTLPGLLSVGLWLYATRGHRLVDPKLDPRLIRIITLRALSSPLLFLLSIGVSFVNPLWAMYSWTLLLVVYWSSGRTGRTRSGKQEQPHAACSLGGIPSVADGSASSADVPEARQRQST